MIGLGWFQVQIQITINGINGFSFRCLRKVWHIKNNQVLIGVVSVILFLQMNKFMMANVGDTKIQMLKLKI